MKIAFGISARILDRKLGLSVSTDKLKTLERALVSSAKSGRLGICGKSGTLGRPSLYRTRATCFYISCLRMNLSMLPKYLYTYAIRSDSIRCAGRDSLARVQDSLTLFEKHRKDSLSQIRLPFGNYELRYYSFTKKFFGQNGEWNLTA